MSTSTGTITETPLQAALRGARANIAPGLVLQTFALILVLAYYWHAGSRLWFDRVAAMREDIGVLFPMATTAVFGAIIPSVYQWLLPSTRRSQSWKKFAALVVFWAYKGAEVDLLYRILADLVGTGNGVGTIAIKSFIDQGIYCPIWAVPSCWAMYALIAADLDAAKVWSDLRTRGWYKRSVLPVLISNLGVWLPAVALIYALPTGLQLPMQNLVLCFFTLMITTVTSGARTPGAIQA